eukprot:SAG31_NODE_1703_length_7495_cov_3.115062_6_plen_266_part_00
MACRDNSSSSSDDEDERPRALGERLAIDLDTLQFGDELSAETMAALRSHVADLTDEEATAAKNEGAGVSENFGLSQFWYDESTSKALACEALERSNGGKIAILSAPSAYRSLVEVVDPACKMRAFCFEYDRRFAQTFGSQYVYYDFNDPDNVPASLRGQCDYIMVDPPYLNPDAVEKYARTIRALARPPEDGEMPPPCANGDPGVPVPFCYLSGAVVEEPLWHNLGCRPNNFTPTFSSKLSNQFYCYTNYNSARFGGFLDGLTLT